MLQSKALGPATGVHFSEEMTMPKRTARTVIFASLTLLAATALAQTPKTLIVYPAKNQTAQQQQKDEGECYTWAVQNTGIDPAVLAQTPVQAQAAPPPPPSGPTGERARGAVRGAAAGAVIGEVANNDADQGAKVGATAGVLAGGARSRQQKRAAQEQAQASQQQAQQQAEAQRAAQMDTFNKAKGACLEGRGYTVSK